MMVMGAILDGIEARLVDVGCSMSQPASQNGKIKFHDETFRDFQKERVGTIWSALRGITLENNWNLEIHTGLSGTETPVTFVSERQFLSLDLAVAVGVAIYRGNIWSEPKGFVLIGQLDLSGKVREVPGVYQMARAAVRAGYSVVAPWKSEFELQRVQAEFPDAKIYPVGSLETALDVLSEYSEPYRLYLRDIKVPPSPLDYSDGGFDPEAIRAVEIALVGQHSLVLEGPEGSGRGAIARRSQSIATSRDPIVTNSIYSAVGLDLPIGVPFRTPHHTIGLSLLGMELSLAHGGILLLDELESWNPEVVKFVVQSHRDGFVQVGFHRFPCSFTLLATVNPCQCGLGVCLCQTEAVQQYRERLDFLTCGFDMKIKVRTRTKRLQAGLVESSESRKIRVAQAIRNLPEGKPQGRHEVLVQTIQALYGEGLVEAQHDAFFLESK